MTTIGEQKRVVRTVCQKYQSIPWVPLAKNQRKTSRDAPARGGVWISRSSFPAPPETTLRDALYTVCERLKAPHQTIIAATEVPLLDVALEFVGNRAGVPSDAAEPDIPEPSKLKLLESECESDMTILYMHGGGL